MTKGFVDILGAKFYYEAAGEGQPLVLVHAGIADSRMWDEQFAAFGQHYRVLRYDRRGFGLTPMVAGEYSHHDDLYSLLKQLGIQRAYLVGCSQGAKTVLDFTLEHPDMVGALVLVAPAVSGLIYNGTAPRQAQEYELAEQAGDIERVNELELQIWVDGAGRSPEQVDPGVRERVREMNAIALRTPGALGDEQSLVPPAAGRLGEVRTPTLIITGNYDTPRTLAAADYLVENITGARRVIIPGTAHLPNMEQPESFNRHVRTFLESLDVEKRD